MSDFLDPRMWLFWLWRYTTWWMPILALIGFGCLLGFSAGRWWPILSTGRF